MWNPVGRFLNRKKSKSDCECNVESSPVGELKMAYKTSVSEKWSYHMTELPLNDQVEKDGRQTVSPSAQENFAGESASEKQLH